LYTDGLYGADNATGPRLSPANLAELLHPPGASAQALINRVIEDATSGKPEKPLSDDVAAVAVRRTR
jgi:hypothetical protein